MILNDRQIRALIDSGEFALDPFEDALIQPSSIDLRLDRPARRIAPGEVFDIRDDAEKLYEPLQIGEHGLVLAPHGLLLVQTVEHMKIPANCQGLIEQRSSVLRIGIQVHSSLVNAGYEGNLPLSLHNLTDRPIRIYAGLPICQLALVRLTERPMTIYPEKTDAKYHGERSAMTSLLHEDVRRWVRPSPRLAHPEQLKDFTMVVRREDSGDDPV